MEAQLFEPGTIPEYSTPGWYAGRERAPHVDEPLHKGRINEALLLIRRISMVMGLRTLSDLGAGDGGLLQLLADDDMECWGYDLQQSNVDGAAERGVDVTLADIFTDQITYGQIVVATEMIEHLVDPHGFVRWVKDHARVLVASSPWTETDESHYDFHTWAWDMYGYRKLFEDAGWYVFAHERAGMFQVLMAIDAKAFRRAAA